MDFSNIKLIVLDVDGVLTNGKKVIDLEGKVFSKEFNDKDFSAINRLGEKYEIVFISGDDRVNKQLFNTKWHFIHEYKDKWKVLNNLLSKKGLLHKQVLFIGDDWPDIGCLKNLPCSICPADAILQVKAASKYVMSTNGGDGIMVELLNLLEDYYEN